MEKGLLHSLLLFSIENDYLPDTEKNTNKVAKNSSTFTKLLKF